MHIACIVTTPYPVIFSYSPHNMITFETALTQNCRLTLMLKLFCLSRVIWSSVLYVNNYPCQVYYTQSGREWAGDCIPCTRDCNCVYLLGILLLEFCNAACVSCVVSTELYWFVYTWTCLVFIENLSLPVALLFARCVRSYCYLGTFYCYIVTFYSYSNPEE